jgi:hypothetical protein
MRRKFSLAGILLLLASPAQAQQKVRGQGIRFKRQIGSARRGRKDQEQACRTHREGRLPVNPASLRSAGGL